MNNYAAFILSYKRPDDQKTLNYIIKAGYTGKWYIVIDDSDPTVEQYITNYGKDHILIFNKLEMLKITDIPIYPPELNFAVYARNAIEKFAVDMGLDSFIAFDDDVLGLSLRYEYDGKLRNRGLTHNITEIFEGILNYMLEADISCTSPAYNNCYWGGIQGLTEQNLKDYLRMPIEIFFRNTKFKVNWVNLMGEDLVSGIKYGRSGQVWLMLPILQVIMPPCLKMTAEGGHTDTYRKYSPISLNLFFKVMTPNCFNISLVKNNWSHSIRKDYCVPKIVVEG